MKEESDKEEKGEDTHGFSVKEKILTAVLAVIVVTVTVNTVMNVQIYKKLFSENEIVTFESINESAERVLFESSPTGSVTASVSDSTDGQSDDGIRSAADSVANSVRLHGSDTDDDDSDRRVNINTASSEELQTLPGIGETIAQHIIDYRKANGKFYYIEEIKNVPRIGEKTFEKIKNLITV